MSRSSVQQRHGLGVARRRRRRRARLRSRRRRPRFFTLTSALARSGGPEGEHRAGWRTSPWSRGEAGCPRRSASARTPWTGPRMPDLDDSAARRGPAAGAAGARQGINGSGLHPLGGDDGQPGERAHRQSSGPRTWPNNYIRTPSRRHTARAVIRLGKTILILRSATATHTRIWTPP